MNPLPIDGILRDAIMVAQAIQTSVEKAAYNRRALQKLSAEVVMALLDLGKFYNERAHLLDGATELRDALDKLCTEMRAVRGRCHELFSSNASGIINKALSAFSAWKKCNEIEAEILELKDRVQACFIKFTAFTVARLEPPITRIVHSTSRIERNLLVLTDEQRAGLSRIEEAVASLRIEETVVSLRVDEQSEGVSGHGGPVPSANSIEISPEDIATLYLHQQIETISQSLGQLANAQTFPNEQPRGEYLQPFRTILRTSPPTGDASALHREVVMMSLQILQLLQDSTAQLSIQEGAWDMVNLAISLHGLEMYSDAVTIGTWTVALYRTLISANAQNAKVFEPYLALALRNLSRYFTDVDDLDRASVTIDECVRRHRALLEGSSPHPSLQLANTLIEYWGILSMKQDHQKCMEVAQDSLDILDSVQEWNDIELERFAIEDQSEWDNNSELWLDYNTARALHSLSCSLSDAGHHTDAYDKEIRAVNILRNLCQRFPGTFDSNLAQSLAHLSSPPLSVTLSASESDTLSFAEEAVGIYRDLCERSPRKYTDTFVEKLWVYATLLHENGDLDGAQRASVEAIEMIRKSRHDRRLLADALQQTSWSLRRLKLHETAVNIQTEAVDIYRVLVSSHSAHSSESDLPPTAVADGLLNLASDLLLTGKSDDAVMVCREAIQCYRAIPTTENNLQKGGLANGLSYLVHTLSIAQKFNDALPEGDEALGLYRQLIREDSDQYLQPFLRALRRISFSTAHANNPQALIKSTEVIEEYRKLVISHQAELTETDVKWDQVYALENHSYVLEKARRFREVMLHTQDLVKLIRAAEINDVLARKVFVRGLKSYAECLESAGQVEEAVGILEEALEIGRKFLDDEGDLALPLIETYRQYANCLRHLGRCKDALAAVENGMKIHYQHPQTLEDGTWFAFTLNALTFALRGMRSYERARKICERALTICRASPSKSVFMEARVPYILDTLSTCTLDIGEKVEALALAQESVTLYQKIRDTPSSICPLAFVEPIYASAQVTLATCYAANGRWDKVKDLLVEAKETFQRLVVDCPGYLPNLAWTLDLLAVYYCAVGHHGDGITTMKDLDGRQSLLEVSNPKLAMLVRISLDDKRGHPSQVNLRQEYLSCLHSHTSGKP